MRTSLFAGILVAALVAPAAADRTEDDLQLVKKAVASSPVAQARPPAEEPLPPRAEAAPPARKGEPTWFRVRVVEKGTKHAKVSVNLPLGLVRALGDEWPIAGHGRCREERRCPRLGEVLRALDSGQSLVEIEDDETTVRVWVE
jgi:hypothetical protein